MSLLEVRDLHVAYDGIKAVRGIDIALDEGEIVSLVGSNGAGKSTTLRAICGITPFQSGKILLGGKDIRSIPPHLLVKEGVSLVPEGRGLFGRSTVEENLMMGAYSRRDAEIGKDIEKVYSLFPRLMERRKQAAGTLSGGEQQMVSLGRALMSRPRLLFLDEPSMGLAPIMVQKIFEIVRTIASTGMTIL
ncbi:MAG TPA: ABC transporter ATP-binding protein, partial [Burkholderiales bacterium]|nr:ABC transporter ATP-binding protein [Burkholderiales bacterium]